MNAAIERPATSSPTTRAARPALRVAFVVPGWPATEFANGIVTYATQLGAALADAGVERFVVARRMNNAPRESFVLHAGAPGAAPGLLGRARAALLRRLAPQRWSIEQYAEPTVRVLRQLIAGGRIDLAQMEETWGWAGHVATHIDVPLVVRLHGPWFLSGAAYGASGREFERRVRLERDGLTAAAGVTAPSRDVLEQTRACYGLALAHAQVIANPMPRAEPHELWQPQAADPRHLLFVGRFDRTKGADLVLQAFGRLRREFGDLRLTFVGPDKGLLDDAGRRWSLPEYLNERQWSAADRAALTVLDRQPPAQLDELRRGAALTLVASRYETFGNVALEAMRLGCPTVVPEVGGLRDIVEHDRTGLLFPVGHLDGLVAAVRHLLLNPGHAAQLGAAARQTVALRYAPETIAAQTLSYYRETLARAACAPRESRA